MKTQFTFKQTAIRLALASTFALASLTGGNVFAASASSTATTTIIAPIAVTAGAVLSFGKFSSLAAGTIKVEPDGTAAVTGGVTRGTGATSTAAQFAVTGDASNTYSITHTGDATLVHGSDGTKTMALAKVSALTAATSTTNVSSGTLSAGAQTIFVGGTLTVGVSQLAGTYTGAVGVTVEYN